MVIIMINIIRAYVISTEATLKKLYLFLRFILKICTELASTVILIVGYKG